MTIQNDVAKCIAGLLGFTAILSGAFGAHLFRGLLQNQGTMQIWQTGALYHLVHAVVLLVLSTWQPVPAIAFTLVLGGVIVFSGSLYALALTNFHWLGAITPLGGLCILAGWLALAFGKMASS
jgi:uncharacterized membrane protein YgdD (TMEM256/DUF423 family)